MGYVRTFSDQIRRADGSTREVSFVVGSGFYGSASQEVAEGGNAVIESVLPQVMRAMTASTVDAVSSRIERATSGTAPPAALSFGGATTLSDALRANAHALANDTFDVGRLLANSSFTLPLNAAGGEGSGPFGDLTFWGSGDYRSISGGNPQSVDYDGNVTSANLGIDTRLGADMLAGLAVSHARGTVDYTASNASGELTTSLTSVNPYVGWQMAGGMNLWATGGYGSGEVEVDDESADAQARDLTQRMVAAGVKWPLVSSDEMIAGGTTNLNLKGELALPVPHISCWTCHDGEVIRIHRAVRRQRTWPQAGYSRATEAARRAGRVYGPTTLRGERAARPLRPDAAGARGCASGRRWRAHAGRCRRTAPRRAPPAPRAQDGPSTGCAKRSPS